eukprot:5305500-Amphidinium_carterae.1
MLWKHKIVLCTTAEFTQPNCAWVSQAHGREFVAHCDYSGALAENRNELPHRKQNARLALNC